MDNVPVGEAIDFVLGQAPDVPEEEPDFVAFSDFPLASRPPGRVPFSIVDERSASWYIAKLRACDDEEAAIRAMSVEMLADVAKRRARLKARFEPQLRAWALAQIEGARTKTVKLYTGAVAFVSVPGGRRIVDAKAAFEEARKNFSRFIVTKQSQALDNAAYLANAEAVFLQTGELLPGVDNVQSVERMDIKPPKAGKGGAV